MRTGMLLLLTELETWEEGIHTQKYYKLNYKQFEREFDFYAHIYSLIKEKSRRV